MGKRKPGFYNRTGLKYTFVVLNENTMEWEEQLPHDNAKDDVCSDTFIAEGRGPGRRLNLLDEAVVRAHGSAEAVNRLPHHRQRRAGSKNKWNSRGTGRIKHDESVP